MGKYGASRTGDMGGVGMMGGVGIMGAVGGVGGARRPPTHLLGNCRQPRRGTSWKSDCYLF